MTSLTKISIPSQIIQICEGAFSDQKKVENIEIPENSELQIIEEHAFFYTSISETLFMIVVLNCYLM